MSRIQKLWQDGTLPIEDSVHFTDGRSNAVEIAASALQSTGQVEPATDWLTAIHITRESPAPHGFVCAGNGSHGSEGFFARPDADRSLIWVRYLSESNPINKLTVLGHQLTVISTSGVTITVESLPSR